MNIKPFYLIKCLPLRKQQIYLAIFRHAYNADHTGCLLFLPVFFVPVFIGNKITTMEEKTHPGSHFKLSPFSASLKPQKEPGYTLN